MPDKHAHNKPAVSAELIRQYLAGELDDKAMHDLERQALDDPFLADALEGYALHAPDQQAHQEDLMARLTERVAPSKAVVRPLYPRLAAAAAILLLLFTGGWYLFREQQRSTTTPIAQVDTRRDVAVPDTAAPAPAAPATPEIAMVKPADTNSNSDQQPAPVARQSAPALAKAEEPAADISAADERLAERPLERRALKQVPPPATFSAPVPPPSAVAASPVTDKQLNEIVIAHPDSSAMAYDKEKSADLKDVKVTGFAAQNKKAGISGQNDSIHPNADGYEVAGILQGRAAGVVTTNAALRKRKAAIVPGDTLPSPVNGRTAFQQYLAEHTANPGGFNGVVRISFTVMPDSTLQDIKVVRSVHVNAACEAEAIRVVKEGPLWKPAADGKPANVTLDVIFKEKTGQ
ncbi:energy transducer TonB [Chitinophaga sp.]|uniref:energy transducer TonB n=1 Tax=Chitinophaga sp. TaxID=1869181 RepID=UPI0031D748C2